MSKCRQNIWSGAWHISPQCVLVAHWCPTLCDPIDCSPSGSSVHGVVQARMLEWVAISFPRGSSPPRDGSQVSCISCTDGRILHHCQRRRMLRQTWDFPDGTVDKNPPASAGALRDLGLIPESGRSLGGHGNPLQYSCPEDTTNRGA